MKKIFFSLSLLSVAFVSNLHAEADQKNMHYKNQTLNDLHANGKIKVDRTKVLGSTQIEGSLHAEDATFSTLEVVGDVDLGRSTVNGQVLINGNMHVDKSTFNRPVLVNGNLKSNESSFNENLTTAGEKTELRRTSVASLVVKKGQGDKKQIIDLDSSTIIGNVSVESGQGEIWLKNSEIHGQVSGAQVIKK